MWQKIARRFKGNPAVWAYDIINEPVKQDPGLYDYLSLQERAVKAIRRIDPDTPIIIASNESNSPLAFGELRPLPYRNLIYQAHMYLPLSYTHQYVRGNWQASAVMNNLLTYPGIIDGKYYDRNELRKQLQQVRDFQLKYGARIYIGEFSAVRWAPGADKYLDDCISLFEEYGWDWSYHAFREWVGWSVEHIEEFGRTELSATVTARKNVILRYFGLNQRPASPTSVGACPTPAGSR